MFGLFGGSSKKEKAKLDDIQKLIDDHKSDTADTDLDVMLQGAQDLKAAFNVEVSRSSPSNKVLLRIEQLSDGILSNLEERITEELLSEDRGSAIASRCATIAKELDDVRATKASTLLTKRTEKMQEKLAQSVMKEVQEAFGKVAADQKDGVPHANIMVHAKAILDAVENVHSQAPTSKVITARLMEVCVKLARLVLQLLMPSLQADAANGERAKQNADRLDAIAEKLVAVIGSTWDPPAAPQVDAKVDEAIKIVMANNLKIVEDELAKDGINQDIILQVYTSIQPWWPLVKEVEECSKALQGLSEKVDTAMINMFSTIVTAGDKATADILLKFAEDMDKATAAFHGIEVSETSLRSKMMDKLADVGQKLDALDADFAKYPEDGLEVASMNMALSTLEGLAPIWKMTVATDASMVDRLDGTLGVLEARVTTTVAASPLAKALQFFKAAAKYDSYRVDFELEEHGLEKSLAPLVATVSLNDAEVEVAKTESVDIGAILKALEEFKSDKSPVLKSCINDDADLKSRVQNTLQALEELIVKEFKSAADTGEKKRLQELGQFGVRFDALCLDMEPDAPKDLANMLRLLNGVVATEKQVATNGDLDCSVVNKALEAITKLASPPKSAPEEIVTRMQALRPSLNDALFAKTLTADDATMSIVIDCAKNIEIALAAVEKRTPTEAGAEYSESLTKTREVNKSLLSIQAEFEKESGRDPNVVLMALLGLTSTWASVAEVADFNQRLLNVFTELKTRLCAACEAAFVNGDLAKVSRLLRYSKRCDAVRSSADGDAHICEALAQTVVNYNLNVIKEELAKDSGFHPKRILDALRALNPHFQCLGDGLDGAQKTLAARRGAIAKRMAKAWDEAELASDKRKMEGLREFASKYDSAFEDIGEISGFLEVIELHTDAPGVEEGPAEEEEEEEEDDVWVAPLRFSNEVEEKQEDDDVWVDTAGSSSETADDAITKLSDADLAQIIAMLPSPLKDPYVAEANRRKG